MMSPAAWDEDRFATLDVAPRLLYLYFVTGPLSSGGVPGLFRGGPSAFAEGLRLSHEIIVEAMAALTKTGIIEHDDRKRVVRIPSQPLECKPGNPNVLRGWFRRWRDFPDCDLKFHHVESIRDAFLSTSWYSKLKAKDASVWDDTFGSIVVGVKGLDTVPDTLSKPFQLTPPKKEDLNGFQTIRKQTDPLPLPEPDPKPKPKPDPERISKNPNAIRLAEKLFELIVVRLPEHTLATMTPAERESTLASWAFEVDEATAEGRRSWEAVESVIEFSQSSWWAQHVHEPFTLFAKWDKLVGAMNQPNSRESSWHDAGRETPLEAVESFEAAGGES